MDLLNENFDNCKFIFMIRNPYAVVEGMMRRLSFSARRAIVHWIKCTNKQIEKYYQYKDRSLFLFYEDFCDYSEEIEKRIYEFEPLLNDIKIAGEIKCHSIESVGHNNMPIKNYNEEQIGNLSKEHKMFIKFALLNNFDKIEKNEIIEKILAKYIDF